eukprot:TRINITY_DN8626_c0_g1_i1.p1 TRINITY_DN8626_c0_g1~~TRINITY_DN8626_c0_g1_i1.p1  ORF type:complete len:110 (+),score=35.69 TRINITY_DN8626_c0_g1_i1:145-474(+)
MIRRPPRSTHCISSAASDVYKRQVHGNAEYMGENSCSYSNYQEENEQIVFKKFTVQKSQFQNFQQSNLSPLINLSSSLINSSKEEQQSFFRYLIEAYIKTQFEFILSQQ